MQPPIAPVAAAQPPPPPPAPRKAVELVLVQNPGDDVCFAKHDEPGPDGRPSAAARLQIMKPASCMQKQCPRPMDMAYKGNQA